MSIIQNLNTLPETDYISQPHFSVTIDESKNKSIFKVKTSDIVKFNLGLAYFIVLAFLAVKLFLG
jgi:hypothetical protein